MKSTSVAILGIWSFIYLTMYFLWSNPLITGTLPDPDDYMRMVRVFDLLDGKNLSSNIQPRLGVDSMAENPWSRLIDWPLVLLQGGAEFFFERESAAMLSAGLMSAFALLVFVISSCWSFKASFPKERAINFLFLFFSLFCMWGLLRQFMPGRVDHHMWQIIITVIAFGLLFNIYKKPDSFYYPVLLGAALATGLEIGADSIPALSFVTILLGVIWLLDGKVYERAGLFFAASLYAIASIYHAFMHDTGRFLAAECDAHSLVWLSLAGMVLVFWVLANILPDVVKDNALKRLFLGAVISTPLLISFYFAFPHCAEDVYKIEHEAVREIWLGVVFEAQSVLDVWKYSPATALFFMLPASLAFIGSALSVKIFKEERGYWLGLCAVIICAMALTAYQIRTGDILLALCIVPLAYMFSHVFDLIKSAISKIKLARSIRISMAALFFLCSLCALIFSSMHKQQNEIAKEKLATCNIKLAAKALSKIDQPLLIAAHIDEGSELLFRTHHNVLAAPYHRNQDGIKAVYDIFTAKSDTLAFGAMHRYKADVVMLCARKDNYWLIRAGSEENFAHKIVSGDVPVWLQPIRGETGGYNIYKRIFK